MSTRPPVCYLSGPMSGLPEYNVPAFRAAATLLRAQGLVVLSPVEMGQSWFGNATDAVPPEEYLRVDVAEMATRCTQIALLPGWMGSIGANVEVALAIALGFEFFDAETGARIPRPRVAVVTRGYRDPAPPRFYGPRGQPIIIDPAPARLPGDAHG